MKNKPSYLLVTSTLFLLVAALSGALYASFSISNTRNDVAQLPNRVESPDPWNPDEDPITDKIQSVEDSIRQTREMIRQQKSQTREMMIRGQLKKSVQQNDVESLIHIGHEEFNRARRQVEEEEEDNDRRRNRDENQKRLVSNVLNLQSGQAEQVWNTLEEQEENREETIEEFTEQFGEDGEPDQSDIQNLQSRLNRLHSDNLTELQGQLTSDQYDRYKNWIQSGNRWMTTEWERLESGGMVETQILGEQVEVEYHGPDEVRDRYGGRR